MEAMDPRIPVGLVQLIEDTLGVFGGKDLTPASRGVRVTCK
jgi:hypothetical protein